MVRAEHAAPDRLLLRRELSVTSLFYGTVQHGVRLFTIDQALIFEVHIVLFQAINFQHYVVDSQVWKARKKVNRQALGIAT